MDLLKTYYDIIVKNIKEKTPPSRQAPDYDCVADTGCDANSILRLERNGEFYHFTIKILAQVKPLFTDRLVLKALDFIMVEEYDSIIRLFEIKDEFISHGYDVIFYSIFKWLKVCKIEIPELGKPKFSYYLNDLESRLYISRSDTINLPMEIVDVGVNVVPSEWIGRKFKTGKDLHLEIDKLDWRRGKPPVTYCCIYSMKKIQKDNTYLVKNLDVNNIKSDTIMVKIDTNHQAHFIKLVPDTGYSNFVTYSTENHNLIIFYNPVDHFDNEIKLKKQSVGLLSSTLQKAIRHGSCSLVILEDTVNKLARAKPYNLPEQQYLKVSGSRQLFWRLFITCIEDFRFYYDSNYLNLFDLLILACICNKEPDYKIRDSLLEKIRNLVLAIAKADSVSDYFEWRTFVEKKPEFNLNNKIGQNIMFLASEFVPKMSGDEIMIRKYFDLLQSYQPSGLISNPNQVICKKCAIGLNPIYTGVDIHSYPIMILKLQAILRTKLTTQEISSLVWELNSKFNNRKPHEFIDSMFDSVYIKRMHQLQQEYWGQFINLFDIIKPNEINEQKQIIKPDTKINQLTPYDARVLFLKVFGKKIRIPVTKYNERVLEIVLSHEDWMSYNKPIQIKYVNSDEYLNGSDYDENINRVYMYLKTNPHMVQIDSCIIGYKWIIESIVKFGVDSNNNPVIYSNKNTIQLNWFDGSKLVQPLEIKPYEKPNYIQISIIRNMLESVHSLSLMDCNVECSKKRLGDLFDLKLFESDFTKQNIDRLNGVLVKIQTSYDQIITISQVSRVGMKIDESVDYLNEGKFLLMLNLLNYCYPNALIKKGELKFIANTSDPAYSQMIRDINYILRRKPIIDKTIKSDIKIKTKLWEHQESTVRFIIKNIKEGKKGFGDASNVGAGKTLTALATSLQIYLMDSNEKHILILLPTDKLYKTWEDEINKHFIGLNYMKQSADGSYMGIETSGLNLWISTMGRNREHPINRDWGFVIIDECLTVQNKEALQTMEAWKQAVKSKYGILLLSATFFRTRFDKLLYMLKMLATHLPENKDYLDTILMDSIKVNLPLNKRTWTETLYKKSMDKDWMDKYNEINQMDISNELKYIKLEKFIRENVDYIKVFENHIKTILENDPNARILIYAASKKEAELISLIPNVGLYPDINKTHCVVSYANGTYGLNDLVKFNHILTRPPEPDKLPQMKGRLDRPGQNEDKLFINYIILKDTIEEAHYLRLEICNKFYSNHIMPLSDLYDLALGNKTKELVL